MNDEYFEKMLARLNKARFNERYGFVQPENSIDILKQIARDQREACEKAILEKYDLINCKDDLCNAIRTAEIEKN